MPPLTDIASVLGGGGAVAIERDLVTLSGCQFVGNSALSPTGTGNAFGGAISAGSGAVLSTTVFANNIAVGLSGGIDILRTYSVVQCTECTLGIGGAAFIQGGLGSLTDCQFISNVASSPAGSGTTFGGAIILIAGGIINSTVFTNNTATGSAQSANYECVCDLALKYL